MFVRFWDHAKYLTFRWPFKIHFYANAVFFWRKKNPGKLWKSIKSHKNQWTFKKYCEIFFLSFHEFSRVLWVFTNVYEFVKWKTYENSLQSWKKKINVKTQLSLNFQQFTDRVSHTLKLIKQKLSFSSIFHPLSQLISWLKVSLGRDERKPLKENNTRKRSWKGLFLNCFHRHSRNC